MVTSTFPGKPQKTEMNGSDSSNQRSDSKSSSSAILLPEPQDIDFSRSQSSTSSSPIADELTSLPGSPFYRQVLRRRSSSIDSSFSRPGSDFLEVPLLLAQPKDRSPSSAQFTDESLGDSPAMSPIFVTDDGHSSDLQHQVVHRLSDDVQLPAFTPCPSPEYATTDGGHGADQGKPGRRRVDRGSSGQPHNGRWR